ncbi:MAG: ORF6N domain-containing protein [Candidatus Omnitrophica bacterium]|nr:ORF6N domain-containing protein [Candidatus Omnitrophota bacterium]
MEKLVPIDKIESRIFQIRGKKVMLDEDLALLYEVETYQLTRQVRRNVERFPEDFMFQLTRQEFLSCQNGSSSYGGRRYMPYAFTEQGIAMLSSVLNSRRAIRVNIQIMRAFVKLRRIGLTYAGLRHKIEDMEKKYDKQFGIVFKAIKKLMEPPSAKPKPKIGFHP